MQMIISYETCCVSPCAMRLPASGSSRNIGRLQSNAGNNRSMPWPNDTDSGRKRHEEKYVVEGL